ncbi:hypothetical protein [Allostreptomyces psammosilenae]|uniref:Uncharacterized protein n=1 Tax=Allostreptomyces psammosilenae TaxID=1892865 RepID=A0A852ZUQ5_9ACTN|nr:hypothetical protein [Allostreptomyces psammosilenae]NYI04504.1 hypothetical protein [Allostreptomyces psammosilenae]
MAESTEHGTHEIPGRETGPLTGAWPVARPRRGTDTPATAPMPGQSGEAAGDPATWSDDAHAAARALTGAPASGPGADPGQTSAQGADAPAPPGADPVGELLPATARDELRTRWKEVQGAFVDRPSASVEEADRLLEGALARLAEAVSAQREELRGAWKPGRGGSERGDAARTEELRVVLQRYRRLVQRLAAV